MMINKDQKQQILADIEQMVTKADELPEGDERQKLVDKIAEQTIKYQAED